MRADFPWLAGGGGNDPGAIGRGANAQCRAELSIGEGKWTIFLERPGSLTLIIIVLMVLILPRMLRGWAARKLVRAQGLTDH